jgi:hypothetical protein
MADELAVIDPEGAHLAALRRLADFESCRVLELCCGDGRLTPSMPPSGSSGLEVELGSPCPSGISDSGLTILLDDAPDPSEVEPGDPGVGLVHLSCLIDDHPELGRGLDIAREYGVADLDDDGEWVVGDLSRLAWRRLANATGGATT